MASETKTFTDPRLCAALVDRLIFVGQIIETGSTSYRLAHARSAAARYSTRAGPAIRLHPSASAGPWVMAPHS
jgi:hypothetical protein